jgi:hypothetical protein
MVKGRAARVERAGVGITGLEVRVTVEEPERHRRLRRASATVISI